MLDMSIILLPCYMSWQFLCFMYSFKLCLLLTIPQTPVAVTFLSNYQDVFFEKQRNTSLTKIVGREGLLKTKPNNKTPHPIMPHKQQKLQKRKKNLIMNLGSFMMKLPLSFHMCFFTQDHTTFRLPFPACLPPQL